MPSPSINAYYKHYYKAIDMLNFIEEKQVIIYFFTVVAAVVVGLANGITTQFLDYFILPILGFLLYVTFLQVPLVNLVDSMNDLTFMVRLVVANFIVVPVIVGVLIAFLPFDSYILLAIALVLLTPCIDYVIVFTKLGGGNERTMLAVTPLLLILQIILLPVYLYFILGAEFLQIIALWPFLEAFLGLILLPLGLAAITEYLVPHQRKVQQWSRLMRWLPVPLMALTLFIVIASQVWRIEELFIDVLQVIPVYVGYAVVVPLMVWVVSSRLNLSVDKLRTLAFSTATRNSLVVLPLALAIPGYGMLVATMIITQTLIELTAQIVYIRWIPALIKE